MLLECDRPYGTGIDGAFGTPAVDKEFPIALGALDRGVDEADRPNARSVESGDCTLDRLCMDLRVADDAAPADLTLARLKLGFHEEDPVRLGGAKGADLGSNEGEGYEREVSDHEIEGGTKVDWIGMSDVGAFDDRDAVVTPNTVVELAVANVEGDHAGCTTLQ